MPKLEDLNRIDIYQVIDTLSELHISQKFLEICIGAYQGMLSNWKHNPGKDIDKKYHVRIINTLYALKMLKEGYRLVPVKEGEDPQGDIIELLDVVKENCEHIDNRIIRRTTQTYLEEIKKELSGED